MSKGCIAERGGFRTTTSHHGHTRAEFSTHARGMLPMWHMRNCVCVSRLSAGILGDVLHDLHHHTPVHTSLRSINPRVSPNASISAENGFIYTVRDGKYPRSMQHTRHVMCHHPRCHMLFCLHVHPSTDPPWPGFCRAVWVLQGVYHTHPPHQQPLSIITVAISIFTLSTLYGCAVQSSTTYLAWKLWV